MSKKNLIRARLKKETNSRAYKIQLTKLPPYWDDGIKFHQSRGGFRWKKLIKEIFHYQYRMYRTWKYNRKTKYKVK